MKVEIKRWKNEDYGVELTAENEPDNSILERFWEKGIKINAITRRGGNSSLQLTIIADLIGR